MANAVGSKLLQEHELFSRLCHGGFPGESGGYFPENQVTPNRLFRVDAGWFILRRQDAALIRMSHSEKAFDRLTPKCVQDHTTPARREVRLWINLALRNGCAGQT